MAATPFDATAAADLGLDFFIYDEERQQQQQQQLQQQPYQQPYHPQYQQPYTQQPPPPQYTQFQPTTTQYTQPFPPQQPQQQLPTGRCNYVDLTHGSGAVQCGCRCFWSRTPPTPTPASTATTPTANVHQQFGLLTSSIAPAATPAADSGYCMCSHHACFHDHDQAQTQPPASVNTSFFTVIPAPLAAAPLVEIRTEVEQETDAQRAEQENEKPRAALTPVEVGSLQLEQQLEQLQHLQQEQQQQSQDQSIPDTMSWGGLQLDLPPELSTSLANSLPHSNPPLSQKASSTTSSRYMRPFAGRGLDTLPEGQSFATALSTALVPASKALSVTGSIISTASAATTTPVSQTLRAHDARLERLENPSFFASTNSQAINNLKEDYFERHDQVDLRVTELESRMEDVERRIADEGTGSVRGAITESTASISASSAASTVSIATARSVSPDAGLLRQLHSLQQEVALLRQEAALAASGPCAQKPWLLEVVFMPFPLKGLWVEASQFATAAAVSAASAAKRRQEYFSREFLFSAPDEWTCESMQTSEGDKNVPRLLPRACAPGRLIDQRLRSRGLVQTVTVKGGDARAVEAAVAEAFQLDAEAYTAIATTSASTPLGLQHPWVPLRKVHKDSRLRFLTRAEMATPALWTPAFLKESVVMKVGASQGNGQGSGQGSEGNKADKGDGDKKHRLYITQPGAYTQDQQSHANGWSWDKLRGAKAVAADSQNIGQDKDDSVWEWNSRLDEAPVDTQSSDTSSSTDTTEEVADHDSNVPDDVLVDVELDVAHVPTAPITTAAAAQTHVSSRSPSSSQFFTVNQSPVRPISALTFSRSTSSHRLSSARRSMSPFFVSAVQSSGMQSRTSRPPPIRTTSARTSTSISRVSKRRSPSVGFAANFWPRNTPRYSRSPSAAPPSARVRGTTPFCYATPYSNAYNDDEPERQLEDERQQDEVHRRRTYPGYGFNGGFNNGMGMGIGLDDAMDMMGYGSDDYDEVDFDNLDGDDGDGDDDIPMTQDGDDIEVYEDRDDSHLNLSLKDKNKSKALLPEDEPWPGIDSNYEGDSGGYDGSGSSQGSQADGSQSSQGGHVDEDDEMSDENLDPEQPSQASVQDLHDLQADEQRQQHQQHQQHDTFGPVHQPQPSNQLNHLTGQTGQTEPTEPAQFRLFNQQQQQQQYRNYHLDSDSSQPSEYPSTCRPRKRQAAPSVQQPVQINTQQFDMYGHDEGIGFTIHEDEP